jgi:NAD(P)-dependent dehydrogenase (short-subunit alcohol dehydrogenase family)
MNVEDVTHQSLTRDAISLEGQVAVVTGGGAGIGRGIALGLAEFGADIAVLDIDAEAAQRVAAAVRKKGRRARAVTLDVNDRNALRNTIANLATAFGRLDILVNNAGGTRPIALLEMTDSQADRQIDINLRQLIAACQAGANAMIKGGNGGAIINIASIEGMRGAPGFSVYAACKSAMVNYTRTAALELAEHGIRVNAIAPDLVYTEAMFRRHGPPTQDRMDATARYIPLGRSGNFDDCAGVAIFLASRLAAYVTGVTINVDGGTFAASGWTRDGAVGWRLSP